MGSYSCWLGRPAALADFVHHMRGGRVGEYLYASLRVCESPATAQAICMPLIALYLLITGHFARRANGIYYALFFYSNSGIGLVFSLIMTSHRWDDLG